MISNQTIDGVSCEDFNDIAQAARRMAGSTGTAGWGAAVKLFSMLCTPYAVIKMTDEIEELRALLDAPAKAEFSIPDCPDCACVQDGQCLCIPSKPAAQPQGEPVAWLDQVSGAIVTHKLKPMLCESGFEIPLYAEQPAPVAVVMPERMSRQQVINNTHYSEGWNACLDELKRLNPSM